MVRATIEMPAARLTGGKRLVPNKALAQIGIDQSGFDAPV